MTDPKRQSAKKISTETTMEIEKKKNICRKIKVPEIQKPQTLHKMKRSTEKAKT
uniref:Uncharacterized protein n=1 Tax=Nelumbo nucifera TaxID=4432 RepID=A0A822Z739_NELNU|nr:TPA_asm: hypothetical protein HUJ06_000434 [Nelumbo nucifera]